jgi:O-antigen/teichoic acid export membrane protein
MAHGESSGSLRTSVIKGGVYLTLRRGVSAALSLVGMLFLTRIVGPENYGLFNASLAVYNYVQSLGLMGTNAYLIREQREDETTIFHLAFWWLLVFGTALTLLCSALVALMGHFWVRTEGFIPVSLLMLANVPLGLIAFVPQSLAEKQLNYRTVAVVEITAQALYYAASIPLAWYGYGVWALVAGFWVNQLTLTVGYFMSMRYRPRWYFNRHGLEHMLRYSFSQALAGWVYKLRDLAPSFLLLPLAGKEVTGYFALARRFLVILSFAYETAGRLAVPTFSRVQNDAPRLLRALTEAMQLQILMVGIVFVGFQLVAPLILPKILGEKWDFEYILTAFTVLGITTTLASLFSIQGWALFVKSYNWLVFRANASGAASMFIFAYLALSLSPERSYLVAFCLAELVSFLPVFWIQHHGVRKHIGRVEYRLSVVWLIAVVCALLAPWWGWWLYLIAAALLAQPASLRQMRELYRTLRAIRGAASKPAE